MKFLMDENLSVGLAEGLAKFGGDVVHVTTVLPKGSFDPVVLQYASRNGCFIITRDHRIRYRPSERLLVTQGGLGVFFIWGKDKSSWDIIRQVVWQWPNIDKAADNEPRPFMIKVPFRGEKLTRMPL